MIYTVQYFIIDKTYELQTYFENPVPAYIYKNGQVKVQIHL